MNSESTLQHQLPPALRSLFLSNPEVMTSDHVALLGEASELLDLYNLCPPTTLDEYDFCEDLLSRFKDFRQQAPVPAHFDSWPTIIKEQGTFNCAGATLLTLAALKRRGMESMIGRCFEHVVAVVTIEGALFWLDAANNTLEEIEIRRERTIDGSRLLYLNTRIDDFGAVALLPVENIVNVVAGNFKAVSTIVAEENTFVVDAEARERAASFFSSNRELYEDEGLNSKLSSLLSASDVLLDSDEFKEESKLIPILRSIHPDAVPTILDCEL